MAGKRGILHFRASQNSAVAESSAVRVRGCVRDARLLARRSIIEENAMLPETQVSLPTSQWRVEANRRNAQRSTGPRTVAGKNNLRRNALKHGLTAEKLVVVGEDAAGFQATRPAAGSDLVPGFATGLGDSPSALGSLEFGSLAWFRSNSISA